MQRQWPERASAPLLLPFILLNCIAVITAVMAAAGALLKERIREEYATLLENFNNLLRSARIEDGEPGSARQQVWRTLHNGLGPSAPPGPCTVPCLVWWDRSTAAIRALQRCRRLLAAARHHHRPTASPPGRSVAAGTGARRGDGGVCGEDAAGLPRAARRHS